MIGREREEPCLARRFETLAVRTSLLHLGILPTPWYGLQRGTRVRGVGWARCLTRLLPRPPSCGEVSKSEAEQARLTTAVLQPQFRPNKGAAKRGERLCDSTNCRSRLTAAPDLGHLPPLEQELDVSRPDGALASRIVDRVTLRTVVEPLPDLHLVLPLRVGGAVAFFPACIAGMPASTRTTPTSRPTTLPPGEFVEWSASAANAPIAIRLPHPSRAHPPPVWSVGFAGGASRFASSVAPVCRYSRVQPQPLRQSLRRRQTPCPCSMPSKLPRP